MPEDATQLLEDVNRVTEENMRLRLALARISLEDHTLSFMKDIAYEALSR